MLFVDRTEASARHAAAMAAYWHATEPVFVAAFMNWFTNKRPSQRPDRSPT